MFDRGDDHFIKKASCNLVVIIKVCVIPSGVKLIGDVRWVNIITHIYAYLLSLAYKLDGKIHMVKNHLFPA